MQTPDQIRQHYEIEKELADRLRHADREVRGPLYGRIYDELLRRVPHHPYLTRREDARALQVAASEQLAFLSPFLAPETVFLEVGAGDCSLSREVAKRVRACYALDVSREILDTARQPNMEPIISDGCSVPLPPGSITLAYSNQLMEHIHPDDAVEQLSNIFRALAPGGTYLCVTPNRLNGPHDVSKYFVPVATGLHLREYSLSELVQLFRKAGFRRVQPYVRWGRTQFRAPLGALILIESVFARLPSGARKRLGKLRGIRNLLFLQVAALK